jgi:hypothetical protein
MHTEQNPFLGKWLWTGDQVVTRAYMRRLHQLRLKSRRGKMRGTPDAQATRPDREGCLQPGGITRKKIYVGDS